MAHGYPIQVVEVGENDGKLTFRRDRLNFVVSLCADLPLAVYAVSGEFRKGKTTLLNIFLAFNHFREQNEDWRKQSDFKLSGKPCISDFSFLLTNIQ